MKYYDNVVVVESNEDLIRLKKVYGLTASEFKNIEETLWFDLGIVLKDARVSCCR